MSELERIEALEKEIRELKGLNEDGVQSYAFSKITDKKLKELVGIKQVINNDIFTNWFGFKLTFSDELISFFEYLIDKNIYLIKKYNEEDLKVKFIIPLLNKVDFLSYENEFRDFYELALTYKTDKFIFKIETKGAIR